MLEKESRELLMKHCIAYTLQWLKIKEGCGPFGAFIVNDYGVIIEAAVNEVQSLNNCTAHAETLVIQKLQQKLGTYDLSGYNFNLIATGEPCMMCAGTILWSGIKYVYYGATTQDIETTLGFDEGVKCDWINEFQKRGIQVIGEIQRDHCIDLLKFYKENNYTIYKPAR